MSSRQPFFFHFVIPEYYPDHGGIQQSLRRISDSILRSYPASRCAIYAMETKADDYDNVHFVKNLMKKLSRPLSSCSYADSVKPYKQLRYLSLERLVNDHLEQYQDFEHLVISFYSSHTGFYSQMVASRFNLKHISSVRGSDFFVNYLNHTSFGSLEFVLKHADYIVTTNNYQRDLLCALYGEALSRKIRTIHNSLDGPVHPFVNMHFRQPGQTIRLFSDSGFSYKKGTDQILDAFLRLFNDGERVELTIAGDIKEEEKGYWEKRISACKESCPKSFHVVGYKDSVLSLLEDADIYISASLSEGCSNSRILALCSGIPIISTDNGAILDYPFPKTNVVFVPVGDSVKVGSCIRAISNQLRSAEMVLTEQEREKRLGYFSPERERLEWVSIIDKVSAR